MKKMFLFFVLTTSIGFAARDKAIILPPTIENLKWSLHPDEWRFKDEYFLKGQYFKIPKLLGALDKNAPENVKVFKVYANKSRSGEPVLTFGDSKHFYFKRNEVCSIFLNEEILESEHFLFCANGACRPKTSVIKYRVNNLYDLKLSRRKSITETCPFKLDIEDFRSTDDPRISSYILVRFNKILKNEGMLEIPMNGQHVYLDVRACQLEREGSKICEIVDFENSRYEDEWRRLREVQSKRSHQVLNRAIQLLTPCLKANDLKCVNKYLAKKEDIGPAFDETIVSSDILQELKACLKYENLLPHQLASKGIKKACIFNEVPIDKPILAVDYIEAMAADGIRIMK